MIRQRTRSILFATKMTIGGGNICNGAGRIGDIWSIGASVVDNVVTLDV